MKKLLFTLMVLSVACSKDDDPSTSNSIEVVQIGQFDDALNKSVDFFYSKATQSSITVEKGLTVKTFSAPEDGDQTRVVGKVIELDREFITNISVSGYQSVQVYIAKQIGRIYFPNNLACVNKIDFTDVSQLVNEVNGNDDQFVFTIIGASEECPI
jgi:hypothetical protein